MRSASGGCREEYVFKGDAIGQSGKAFLILKHWGYSRKAEEQENFQGRGRREQRPWGRRASMLEVLCLQAQRAGAGLEGAEEAQQSPDAEC